MLQSKYVVVEVTTTTATMTLVQYLITHGFDKFTVVSDLYDHPSLKGKGACSPSSSSPPPTAVTPAPTPSPAPPNNNGKPKMSINDIASNLSKKTSPKAERPPTNGNGHLNGSCGMMNGFNRPPQQQITSLADAHSHLARILEGKARQEAKEQHHHNVVDVQKIILGQTAVEDETEETHDEEKTDSSDSVDFGLGPSDDSIRASLSQLSNLSQLFGFNNTVVEENGSSPARKRHLDGDSSAPEKGRKHRWMTTNELEESRFGRGKNYGRVHCKATYKCALCGKPTTLNSTGSRWNLLRHVIMIHSESKPYQCYDCDFIGIKSNVVSHARQSGHRSDDAMDITTDDMRNEWNTMLHNCFPDYVKAKSRGWQPETEAEPVEIKGELAPKIAKIEV